MTKRLEPSDLQQRYEYYAEKVEIRATPGKGKGLVAVQPIASGELITIVSGYIIPKQFISDYELPYHAFQIEQDLFISPIDSEKFHGIFSVNHSCEPNAGLRGQIALVAMRDIQVGEEICYDYAMTDSDTDGVPPYSLECLCGTAHCRRTITDRDWRRRDLQQKYKGYFSAYLAERIRKEC